MSVKTRYFHLFRFSALVVPAQQTWWLDRGDIMSKILHILLTDYKVDSRVRNETESLYKKGYQVDVFCLKSRDTLKKEFRRGVNIIRYGLSEYKIIKIVTAYFQFIVIALTKNYRLVHAHDFTALPIGFVISRLKRVPLIYDSHELWSESEHEKYHVYIMKIAYLTERYCAKKSNYVITVSDSIKYYLEDYFDNKRIATVRNIPSYIYSQKSNILRERFMISEDIPVFIYEGSIDQKRGINIILNAINKIKELNFRFIFLGDGSYFDDLRDYIKANHLENLVIVLRSVPQNELIKYLSSSDIGVHAISNTCLNHEYCLPNKIFEYIHSGIGMVCTDLKEMSNIVESNVIGLTFKTNDADDLAEKMTTLINNKNLIHDYKVNSYDLSKRLTWDHEFNALEKVYGELLRN